MSAGLSVKDPVSGSWIDYTRDIANLLPPAILAGGVQALDTRTDAGRIYARLAPSIDREATVRAALKYLLNVLEDVRGAELDDVWDPAQIDEATSACIMMGTGAFMLRKFSSVMRHTRLVDAHGGKNDIAPFVDRDMFWRNFDSLLDRVHRETDRKGT